MIAVGFGTWFVFGAHHTTKEFIVGRLNGWALGLDGAIFVLVVGWTIGAPFALYFYIWGRRRRDAAEIEHTNWVNSMSAKREDEVREQIGQMNVQGDCCVD